MFRNACGGALKGEGGGLTVCPMTIHDSAHLHQRIASERGRAAGLGAPSPAQGDKSVPQPKGPPAQGDKSDNRRYQVPADIADN